ncbi:hypothetical protein [Rhodoferax sp.]|uniref:hypothetical protein n=1 Tax=Rhodoferax sp. TaxID=50421 RepID=UPI0025E23D44|nr:hypothetical protein [Rhodoferax sp.]
MSRVFPLVLRTVVLSAVWWAGASGAAQVAAKEKLPQRDLTVELRQVEEGREDGAVRIGTQPDAPLMTPQKIQVRNGEKGSLRMSQAVPLQWVQSANSQSNSISSGGTSVSSSGGGVSQSVQWFEVGQSMSVTPRWAGGQRDATVDIELQQADMAVRHNADMPTQTRQQLSTTVTAPLGQWVTIAASGAAPARQGSYSSKGSTEARRLLQVRVLAP